MSVTLFLPSLATMVQSPPGAPGTLAFHALPVGGGGGALVVTDRRPGAVGSALSSASTMRLGQPAPLTLTVTAAVLAVVP